MLTFSPTFGDNGVKPTEIICDASSWLLRLWDIAARKDIPHIGFRLPIELSEIITRSANVYMCDDLSICGFEFVLRAFPVLEALYAICKEINQRLSHCSGSGLQKNTLYAATRYTMPSTMQHTFIALSPAAEKS